MDHTYQIILALIAMVGALIAWGRERAKNATLIQKKKLDLVEDFGPMLIERVRELERKEKENHQREDTIRTKAEQVISEAALWQRKFELLEKEHSLLKQELDVHRGHVANLQQENELLRKEREQLKGIIRALRDELEAVQRELGMRRSQPPRPPGALSLLQGPVVEEMLKPKSVDDPANSR